MRAMGRAPKSNARTPPAAGIWFVYLLRCADGSLYAGITQDLERRLAEHNGDGPRGARYTRGRRPVTLAWSEAACSRSTATRREGEIKRMGAAAKRELVERRGG